jgi:5S rRNA maturation endonuclease (ribonuclease M5)
MRTPLDVPDLAELAARLGLTVGRGGFGPCPVCGAVRRGRGDPRPPLTIYKGGGWGCLAGCHLGDGKSSTGGDAVALLAYVRCGEQPRAGDPRWPAILAELRGADPVPVSRSSPRPAPPVAAPDPGPDRAEVAALWAACTPLDMLKDNDPALRWLRCRAFSVEGIAALDLARAMPAAGKLPPWVPTLGIVNATWRAVYRFAAPVYDARGELAALRFRAVDSYPPDGLNVPPPGCRFEDRNGRRVLVAPLWTPHGEPVRGETDLPKALAARGCGRAAGLVLADPVGVDLLRGTLKDAWRWDGRVIIVEGETDLWAMSTVSGRANNGSSYAVFGHMAGAWTAAHAARIPDGARVLVATDDDDAGNRYFETVKATLRHRCKVGRERRNNA